MQACRDFSMCSFASKHAARHRHANEQRLWASGQRVLCIRGPTGKFGACDLANIHVLLYPCCGTIRLSVRVGSRMNCQVKCSKGTPSSQAATAPQGTSVAAAALGSALPARLSLICRLPRHHEYVRSSSTPAGCVQAAQGRASNSARGDGSAVHPP